MSQSSEKLEQEAVIQWSKMYDSLRWLHSSLNGAFLQGDKAERARRWKSLERQGAKNGILDLFLPVWKPPYHGLYIEMKYGKNKMTDSQSEYAKFAELNQFKVVTCYNAGEAICAIQTYMGMK